jgi:hypothetical protein
LARFATPDWFFSVEEAKVQPVQPREPAFRLFLARKAPAREATRHRFRLLVKGSGPLQRGFSNIRLVDETDSMSDHPFGCRRSPKLD